MDSKLRKRPPSHAATRGARGAPLNGVRAAVRTPERLLSSQMSGKEARAAPVVRRRARGSAEAVKVVARKESKYASKAVNALLARVKTLGAAHPGLDLMFFARSVTDRRPLGTFSA